MILYKLHQKTLCSPTSNSTQTLKMNNNKHKFLAQFGNTEHINQALDDNDVDVRLLSTKNPLFNTEHINKALDDKDSVIKKHAALHTNATSNNLDKAMSDKDYGVRLTTLHNKNIDKNHVEKGLKDDDIEVIKAARRAKFRLSL